MLNWGRAKATADSDSDIDIDVEGARRLQLHRVIGRGIITGLF